MGNQPPPKVPPKPISLDEQIINMRLTAKRYSRESTKSEKEKEKNITKAKACLKKGDEAGARLFLQSAEQKEKERIQYLQMSHRIEAISGTIKSNQNNVMMAKELERVTPFLQQQANEIPLEEVQGTLEKFQTAMDSMMVGGKIMESAMGKITSDQNTQVNSEKMMQQLKAELNLEAQIQNPSYDMPLNLDKNLNEEQKSFSQS